MSKREHSSYQQDVIKRYYDNLPQQTLGKLAELVTELYLGLRLAVLCRLRSTR